MIAIRTSFDGKTIQVPAELKGGTAGEVIVVVDNSMLQKTSVRQRPSVWDVIAKAHGSRTAEEIDQQFKEEHNAWDAR